MGLALALQCYDHVNECFRGCEGLHTLAFIYGSVTVPRPFGAQAMPILTLDECDIRICLQDYGYMHARTLSVKDDKGESFAFEVRYKAPLHARPE